MEPINLTSITEFLTQLGKQSPRKTTFYLLGGCALYLLGNPRQTLDIDYTTDMSSENQPAFEKLVEQVADGLHLDVEAVLIGEFIPLPPGVAFRQRFVAQYGNLDVYIYDLYTIALSKIARGFEADLEDVLFLLRNGLIEFNELNRLFQTILPDVLKADIDPREFHQYFEEVQNRFLG